MQQLTFLELKPVRSGRDSSPHPASTTTHLSRSFGLALLIASSLGTARAEVMLDVSYRVTLAGLPIGVVSGSVDVDETRYRATAIGATSGLVQIIARGHGDIRASGVRSRGNPVPATYESTIIVRGRSEKVRVDFTERFAKQFSVDPAPPLNPALVPLTQAQRKGVVDPLTAALVHAPDLDGQLGPEVCLRTIPVFDGQLRYDLKLGYKRIENVKTEVGYQGKAVVCSFSFSPVAGHDPDRFLFRYLAAQSDMEVWLAPVAGAGIVVPYRISIYTPLGFGVMQANRFVAEPVSVPAVVH